MVCNVVLISAVEENDRCVCVCVCVCEFSSVQSLSRAQLFATPWTAARQASLLLLLLLSHFNHVRLCATPQMAAHQAPLSMGFPRQEYWSGLSFFPPRKLPEAGIKPVSPALAGILYH